MECRSAHGLWAEGLHMGKTQGVSMDALIAVLKEIAVELHAIRRAIERKK